MLLFCFCFPFSRKIVSFSLFCSVFFSSCLALLFLCFIHCSKRFHCFFRGRIPFDNIDFSYAYFIDHWIRNRLKKKRSIFFVLISLKIYLLFERFNGSGTFWKRIGNAPFQVFKQLTLNRIYAQNWKWLRKINYHQTMSISTTTSWSSSSSSSILSHAFDNRNHHLITRHTTLNNSEHLCFRTKRKLKTTGSSKSMWTFNVFCTSR